MNGMEAAHAAGWCWEEDMQLTGEKKTEQNGQRQGHQTRCLREEAETHWQVCF